jgi:hypothetical protein
MHVRRGLRVTSQERNPTRRARCERSLVQTGFDWTVAAETRSPAMEIDQRIRALCGDLQERLANGKYEGRGPIARRQRTGMSGSPPRPSCIKRRNKPLRLLMNGDRLCVMRRWQLTRHFLRELSGSPV